MSQTEAILSYLREHPGGITQQDCYRLGMGTRLAARISDARGMLGPTERIVTIDEAHDGGTHARYVLVDDARTFRTILDWERYGGSPHDRLGHPKPVSGCEWCIRAAAIDARFAGEPSEPVPDATGPTLWGE